jgi:hypothetical protein
MNELTLPPASCGPVAKAHPTPSVGTAITRCRAYCEDTGGKRCGGSSMVGASRRPAAKVRGSSPRLRLEWCRGGIDVPVVASGSGKTEWTHSLLDGRQDKTGKGRRTGYTSLRKCGPARVVGSEKIIRSGCGNLRRHRDLSLSAVLLWSSPADESAWATLNPTWSAAAGFYEPSRRGLSERNHPPLSQQPRCANDE